MLPVIRHWLWLDHVLVITNMLWLWSCCIAGWIPKLKVWSCCTAGWIPKLKVWSCCTAGWIPKLKVWSCCTAGWIPKLKVWSCCTAGWIPKLKVWSCCTAGWIPKLKVWSCCTAGWIPKLKEETHSDGLGAWIKPDPPVCWSMGNKLRYWHRFSSTRHSNRPNNSCVTFSLTDQVGTHTHTRAHAHTHSLTHTHTHICMHTLVLTYTYTHTHHVPCLWHLLNTQGEGLILQIVRPVTFPWSTDTRPCPSPCYSLLGRCGLWTRHRWWWCSGNRRSGSLAPNTQKHRLKKNAC